MGREGLLGLLFALPHLALFALFLLVPVLYGFYISLHSWHVLARSHPLIGLANYRAALLDDIFWIALRNTAYYVVLVVPLGNLVSLLLALGLAGLWHFGTFYRAVYYLPGIISVAVVAVLWRWLYNTEIGLLNLLFVWPLIQQLGFWYRDIAQVTCGTGILLLIAAACGSGGIGQWINAGAGLVVLAIAASCYRAGRTVANTPIRTADQP